MSLRADKVSLREDYEEEDVKVLYSGSTHTENILMRYVIAHAYSDSARAFDVRLDAKGFKEIECPMGMKICRKRQRLDSHSSVSLFFFLIESRFYSLYEVQQISKKSKLTIENSLTTAEDTFFTGVTPEISTPTRKTYSSIHVD
jgi:hypothetical protein